MIVLLIPTVVVMLLSKEVTSTLLFIVDRHCNMWVTDFLLVFIICRYRCISDEFVAHLLHRFSLLAKVKEMKYVLLIILNLSLFIRNLWPEGVVLFYNTVENKSAEWGVMPWHWYITNAIPKVKFC